MAVLTACGEGGNDSPDSQPEDPPRANAGSAPVRFLARRELSLIGKPIGLLARDVDADGIEDALVLTRDPAQLTLLRGTPGGLTATGFALELGDDLPLGPVAVGAGFALALQGQGQILWFVDGDARAEPLRFEVGGVVRCLGAGRLEANGPACLLASTANNRLALLTADGTRREARLPDSLRGRATLLAPSGDGTLVVGAQLDESLLVFAAEDLVAGGETAAEPRRRIPLGGIPRDACAADLDADGDEELIVVGGDEDVWILGLGLAGGPGRAAREGQPRRLASPGALPLRVSAEDLNGDGRAELVLMDYRDLAYGVLGSFGPAGEPALVQKEYAGQDSVDAAVGDFDGDGKRDLAVANRNARRVSLLLGTGFAEPQRAVFYQAFRVPVGDNPVRVRSGNVDADPLPEAVALEAGERTLTARTNRFGLLSAEGPTVRPQRPPRAHDLADVDGDGDDDLVLLAGDARGHALWVYTADGTGKLVPGEPIPLEAGEGARLVLAGEGTTTRVAVLDALRPVMWWVPLDGGAPRAVELPAPAQAACALQLDDDPESELALATAAGLVLVDGDRARAGSRAGGLPTVARDLTAGDFDGDGRADLALLVRGERDNDPGRVMLLVADGEGFFRPGEVLETGLAPAAVTAGDVDGDGRAELFCAAQNSHQINVWTRPEAEAPMRRLADLGAGLGPLDVHLLDLDGDGRLDLVAANSFSHDLSVIYNLSSKAD